MGAPAGLYENPQPGYVFGVPLLEFHVRLGTVAEMGLPALAAANTFTAVQTIDLGTGTPVAALTGTLLRTLNTDGTATRLEHVGYGATAVQYIGRAIGGTRASASATTDARNFFNFSACGHDGSSALTTVNSQFTVFANGLWDGSNRGVGYKWNGTLNGATAAADWVWLQGTTTTDPFGTFGLGAAPTAGNGLLQFASGATKAYGIAWGTDSFLYRIASNSIKTDGALTAAGTTDSTSGTTGTIISSGGIAAAKNIIGAKGIGHGVTNTATAAGTTTLTSASTTIQIFTGSTTQSVTLPAANVFGAGIAIVFTIKNRSTDAITINRAGADTIDGGTSTTLAGGTNAAVTLASDGVSEWVIT